MPVDSPVRRMDCDAIHLEVNRDLRPADEPPGHGRPDLAVGETSVILLHPPLPLVGISIGMEREHRQNDGLADGRPDPGGQGLELAGVHAVGEGDVLVDIHRDQPYGRRTFPVQCAVRARERPGKAYTVRTGKMQSLR